MNHDPLWAVSPVDGRYHGQVKELSDYFSEGALIRYRLRIEAEYFIALCQLPLPQLKSVNAAEFPKIRKEIYLDLKPEDAKRVKEIEKTTNHDVKAIEYVMKEKFDALGLSAQKEFIHFGLTSQDINNTATPLLMKEAHENILLPQIKTVLDELERMSIAWENVSMLARTHGQPASPTRLGKELHVFVARVKEQLRLLSQIPFSAKFGGATGNFNAHHVAYPSIDWKKFGDDFVSSLGLKRSHPTTQIEHYDNMAAYFDGLKRINTILIDLSRDIWQYIAMNYFKQKIKEGEVGSSAMPHKVNPIDFENAEGNFGMANAVFEFLSSKLPVSRLQRDLTDSTVLRNAGVPIAHTLIALKSLQKGLGKLILNEQALHDDLEENWAVVAEAIQTILRREGYEKPYEALKDLTRVNAHINKDSIHQFIDTLKVSDVVKTELKKISPHNYTGI
ncbi:MAG TPA: adenylosuccinate lyase [Bacteroidia bacterium]|jgi:adenylosuccinate lyase|nr:adenylosuccinate lyase [Bacteroidia bacterium]